MVAFFESPSVSDRIRDLDEARGISVCGHTHTHARSGLAEDVLHLPGYHVAQPPRETSFQDNGQKALTNC